MSGRRVRASLLSLAVVLALATGARADRAVPTLAADLPPAARARLAPVTEHAALTTRVDGPPFEARPEVFEFLLDHPELATHVTQALRLARYRIWRTPEGLAIDDGWGTTGTFEVVHAAPGTRVMLARGEYRQRVLPDIHGAAVVTLDYRATPPRADGRSTIHTAVGGFVRLDSRLLSVAARLATSVAEAKADKEATRLAKLFARTTRAIEDNPAAVIEALRQRPGVPRRDLEDFVRLVSRPPAGGSRAARD